MKLVFIVYFSDPYVRIDLNTINGDINIDSVLTKTKKKVITKAKCVGAVTVFAYLISIGLVTFL